MRKGIEKIVPSDDKKMRHGRVVYAMLPVLKENGLYNYAFEKCIIKKKKYIFSLDDPKEMAPGEFYVRKYFVESTESDLSGWRTRNCLTKLENVVKKPKWQIR